MNRNKDDVLSDFIEMIKHSWTYAKLTEIEKDRLFDLLTHTRITDNIKGTYNQRWEFLNTIYFAYLEGVGYTPVGWRD
jgi:hypothetical protein